MTVGADSLELSVLVLLGMLVSIVILIRLSKWKMTKPLGFSMFALYFVFIGQDLARAK